MLRAMGIEVFRLRGTDESGTPDPAEEVDAAVRVADSAAGVSDAAAAVSESAAGAGEAPDWPELAERVAMCTLCDLSRTRKQTVFGVGRRDADLMVIGEAPGADEDRQGEPFVGRAGQLLNSMLRAIGLERGDVYIANILKCRPPSNRDPRSEETARCSQYLERQIELVSPRAILAVGRIAAQHLLQSDQAIGRLRGQVLSFGADKIPIVVTYHPAYLLRSPQAKAKAWHDLCLVRGKIK